MNLSSQCKSGSLNLTEKKFKRKSVNSIFLFIGLLILTFIDGENGSSTNDIIRIFCYILIIAILTTVLINTNVDVLFSAKSFFWASMKNSFILFAFMSCISAVILENDQIIDYCAIVICFTVVWCLLSLFTHNRVGAYVNAVCAIVLQLIFTIANTFISLLPDDYKFDFSLIPVFIIHITQPEIF